jgi:carboxymethylenebutenolidase
MYRTEPIVEIAKPDVTRGDGAMGVYLARPKGEAGRKRPAILLMQEIFGVNEHIQDVTRRFAAAGYVVAAPDVFYRTGRWLSFGYNQFAETRTHTAALNEEGVVGDMEATLNLLASQPDVDPARIGVVGFCFGGRMSLVAAIRLQRIIKAAAVFYGGGIVSDAPEAAVNRVASITCPVIGFFGAKDAHIPPEHVQRLEQALTAARVNNEIFCYPYADHGFLCDARPSFNARAAEDAWHRTMQFFGAHLGPVPDVEWA